MKIFRKWLMLSISAILLVSCASTPKSKAKDISPSVEIVEHKGTAWGIEQPVWVSQVIGTVNQRELRKSLGLTDKKIWVLTRSGDDLEFLQNWVDQVDARSEIAAAINQKIEDTVTAELRGSNSKIENKELERISKRAANVNTAGLEKETDWWTKTRQLNVDVKKAKDDSDYKYQYNYLVIYSMNEDLFRKQLNISLENIKNEIPNSEELIKKVTDEVIDQALVKVTDAVKSQLTQ